VATPEFFIPRFSVDESETGLEGFAQFADRPVPPADRRPYRITLPADGQEWIAEVGRQLRGIQINRTWRGRPGRRLTDSATVLVIFPESPWIVVTDAPPIGGESSAFVNPFMAGQPTQTEYFAVPR
jgi:hypothetical protein